MKRLKIPKETIERLPLYLRQLERFQELGEGRVTSYQITENLPGIQPNTIRKDLTYFGNYGTQGTGYSVSHLIEELEKVLNLQTTVEVALVGVGNLGTALCNYQQESGRGDLEITLAFDKDPELIGQKVEGTQIRSQEDMEKKVKEKGIKIAIITVPANQAQSVADTLISAGVEGILNFAPTLLDSPEEVEVYQIDIISKLKVLNYGPR
ncbi:MAG: redox-sensing transcriptional repressor Rex [Candidatus Bipolaricaulota bacterium]